MPLLFSQSLTYTMLCPCCSDSHSHIPCYATAVLTVSHTHRAIPHIVNSGQKAITAKNVKQSVVDIWSSSWRLVRGVLDHVSSNKSPCRILFVHYAGSCSERRGFIVPEGSFAINTTTVKIAGQLSGKFVSRGY